MPPSECTPHYDQPSSSSDYADLFGGSSRTVYQPQRQDQELELDLGLNNMDLVAYISPDGEYKVWDRNDPEDVEAAEEFKLCGSDKEREDTLAAWRAARRQGCIQEEAEFKAAADKEENDWYLEVTGMTAAEWKASEVQGKAAKANDAEAAAAIVTDSRLPHITETSVSGTGLTTAEIEAHNRDDGVNFRIFKDDGGAPWETTSPTAHFDTSTSNSTATRTPTAQQTQKKELNAKAEFALGRKERNREKRAAKKAAQSSTTFNSTPAASTNTPKTSKPKKKAAKTPVLTNNTPAQDTKSKRVYKPRGKTTIQAPGPATEHPAPDTKSTVPATENIDDEDGLEAELWAALESEEAAGDHDGLEAELWAALEAEDETGAGGPLSNACNMSTAGTAASSVKGRISVYTNSMEPDDELRPQQGPEMDAESDLGSDLPPEGLAALNGELATAPSRTGSRPAAEKLPVNGMKTMAKAKTNGAKTATRALRWATLHPQKTTSLNQAVVHIHSKPADKAREIFIDTALADVVVHGRREAGKLIMKDAESVLPKLYHLAWKSGPNYRLLAKHMDLRTYCIPLRHLHGRETSERRS